MEVIFLGTGTSQGVPMIACDCAVCRSRDPRDRRSRTSAHVVMGGMHVQVDAAQEFRLQCLANGIVRIDEFILTHGHADHLAGMDDLRRFCDLRGNVALPVWTTEQGAQRVREAYAYAIGEKPQFRGYPAFQPRVMPETLELPGGTIRSTRLHHGAVEVLGLVFEERGTGAKFTYFTDCKAVNADQRALAYGSQLVVLDGLRPEPHPTHMSIPEAIAVAQDIGAPHSYLTHLAHFVAHADSEAMLPPGVRFAYDGLRLRLDGSGVTPIER
ncbi:MAG: MBL fold metallo-hydrolase [Opitutaceae bacterium]